MTEERRNGLRIALIGLASAALYLVGLLSQRAISRNGQRAEVAGEVFRGAAPDGARLAVELGAHWAATVLLFVLYAWVLVLCRNGALRDAGSQRLALLFPVVFNVGLLFARPYQSVDALTYVAHGFMASAYGINPHATAAAEIAYREETAELARDLAALGWIPVHGPSPYGPLWTWLEVAVASLAGGVGGALFLTKVLVVGASLGSAALVWAILGRVRPEDRLLGTLFYLWNPLIVVEFAAEGHNDALMIFCVLLSLFFTVATRPVLSVGTAALGVLLKYLPVVFAPAQAIYLWRRRRSTKAFALAVAPALIAALILAVALYAPYWIGPATFEAVRRQGEPFFAPTPNGIVYWLLSLIFPPNLAPALTTQLLGVLFVGFAFYVGWRARDAAGLLVGCAWISLFYLLIVSAGTWPWYAALPISLMALAPRDFFLPAAVVLALCSRLVAPASKLIDNGFANWDALLPVATTVSVTVPLAILLPLYALHRPRRGGSEKDATRP